MRQGFTLIELMIVIAIIAIIAAIAIPNLLESRVTANENAASTSLKSAIFAGEVQYRSGTYNDLDGDNQGEYGHLGQMSGYLDTYGARADDGAGNNVVVGTPILGRDNAASEGELTLVGREFDASGPTYVTLGDPPAAPALGLDTTAETWQCTIDSSNGYFYCSALPIQGDMDFLVAADQTAINRGERFFVAGACPEDFGTTGRRIFYLTQEGNVLTKAADAAFFAVSGNLVTGTDAGSAVDGAANNPMVLSAMECFTTTPGTPAANFAAAMTNATSQVNRDPVWNRASD